MRLRRPAPAEPRHRHLGPAGARPLGASAALHALALGSTLALLAGAGPGRAQAAGDVPGPEGAAALDRAHEAVERRLFDLVERFDQFFGDDRTLDLERPATRLRLKGSLRLEEGGRFSSRVSLGSTFKLPRLDRWLGNARLVLVGANSQVAAAETGDAEAAAGAPAPPADVSRLRPQDGAAELRFDLFRGTSVTGDLGGGVKLGRPTVPYARARGHARADPADGLVLRGTGALFYELNGDGLGSTAEVSLDVFPTGRLRAGVSAGARWSEVTRGPEWSQVAGVAWVLERRLALYVAAQGLAVSRPLTYDFTRLYAGVRVNLWKGWIFAQLEPEVGWHDGAIGPLRRILAVTSTLEVVAATDPREPPRREPAAPGPAP